MAALTAAIVYAYRILTPWLTGYLRLSAEELRVVSHLHWGIGSLLLVAALSYPAEVYRLPGLGAALFLTRYAIAQGRHPSNRRVGETWVYLGLLEAVGTVGYVAVTVPLLSELAARARPWAGAIATWIGVMIYSQPWQTWGWSRRPWRLTAILAPPLAVGFVLLHHVQPPHALSLLVMAGYYGWLSWQRHQSRWLYASLISVDWAFWLLLPASLHFAKTCLVGLSVMGMTWFEPACRAETGRSLRHYLRCLGMGIIGFDALRLYSQPGIIPGFVGIIGIFLGLGFRIRAFLYVGTVTFLAIATYQMLLSIFAFPMLKWAIGFLLGMLFIWIAASFETRRQQFASAVQNWVVAFEAWD